MGFVFVFIYVFGTIKVKRRCLVFSYSLALPCSNTLTYLTQFPIWLASSLISYSIRSLIFHQCNNLIRWHLLHGTFSIIYVLARIFYAVHICGFVVVAACFVSTIYKLALSCEKFIAMRRQRRPASNFNSDRIVCCWRQFLSVSWLPISTIQSSELRQIDNWRIDNRLKTSHYITDNAAAQN